MTKVETPTIHQSVRSHISTAIRFSTPGRRINLENHRANRISIHTCAQVIPNIVSTASQFYERE
jgi:hypothetical protein